MDNNNNNNDNNDNNIDDSTTKKKRIVTSEPKKSMKSTTIVVLIASLVIAIPLLHWISKLVMVIGGYIITIFASLFILLLSLFSTSELYESSVYQSKYEPFIDTEVDIITNDGRDYTLTFEIEQIENVLDFNIWNPSNLKTLSTTVIIENDEQQLLNVEIPDMRLSPSQLEDFVVDDMGKIRMSFPFNEIHVDFDKQSMTYNDQAYDYGYMNYSTN